MSEAIRHFKVPIAPGDRDACLGPDGSVEHVSRVLRMIGGRWKLPILFRLFAEPSMRTSRLLRDIPGISQKMLTQHLRELGTTASSSGSISPNGRHAWNTGSRRRDGS